MSLFKSLSITLAFRVATLTLGASTAIALARVLGPAGRGELSVLEALSGLFMMFAGQWMLNSNSVYAARDQRSAESLMRNSLIYSLVVGTALVVAFLGLYHQFNGIGVGNIRRTYVLLGLASIPAQFFNNACLGLLLGQKRIVAFNMVSLTVAAVYLCAILVMLMLGRADLRVLLLTTSALHYSISVGLIVYFSRKSGITPSYRFDGELFRQSYRLGVMLLLSSFASYIVLRSNVFLLNFFKGQYEVGIYAIAGRIIDLLVLLPNTIVALLLPHLSGERDATKRHEDTLRLTRVVAAVFVAICAGVLATGQYLIPLVFGREFAASYIPLALSLPGLLLLTVEMILVQHLTALGVLRGVVLTWWIGALASILVNLALIPRFGLAGVGVASSFTYCLVTLGILANYRRIIGLRLRDLVAFERDDFAFIFGRFQRRRI